jgi:site-specific DNA-methyltransferase (adenine-specific)
MIKQEFEGGRLILYNADCLNVMDNLIAQGVVVDAIICDPPYGTTACKWDAVIAFDKMWERLNKLIKPNGAIVLFGSQPFTSALIMSNIKMFKYELIWEKSKHSNFALVNRQHLKTHENICIFSSGKYTYNKQMENRINKNRQKYVIDTTNRKAEGIYGKKIKGQIKFFSTELKSPQSIQYFKLDKGLHPTQKPVSLMEYLIKTYTNENETVLDFTAGSFSTGVACLNTKRKFIGIELDEKYFQVGINRIEDKLKQGRLF